MIEGCINCITKAKDQLFEQALKDARDYAKEQNTPVAIYQENGEWKYVNAFSAYAAGYPVRQVVSVYQ